MVFRLPQFISPLWFPLTIFLFAASVSICKGEVSEHVPKEGDWDDGSNPNAPKRNLTGIPQIDYLTDPNLPHELNGTDLSKYPFLNKVPSNLTFNCDGIKDGFYASIEYKCQLYHHCLFGTRYDFICANYTAFDQRTFICQFVSDVDCLNSGMFFHRNDALYVAQSTTPAPVQASLYSTANRGRSRLTPAPLTQEDSEVVLSEAEANNPEAGKIVPDQDDDRPRNGKVLGDDLEVNNDKEAPRPFARFRPGRRRPVQRQRPTPRPAHDGDDDENVRRPFRKDRPEDEFSETDSPKEELPKRTLSRVTNRRRQQQDDRDVEKKLSSKPPKVEASSNNSTDDASSRFTTAAFPRMRRVFG